MLSSVQTLSTDLLVKALPLATKPHGYTVPPEVAKYECSIVDNANSRAICIQAISDPELAAHVSSCPRCSAQHQYDSW